MKRLTELLVALVGLALIAFGNSALAATECHNTTISGKVAGGVVVNGFCFLDGANISGGVQVNSNGILIACGSTINGGIDSNGAAGLLIGPEEIGCDGNVINGGVSISNTGPGVFPGGAPSIAVENSTINGGLRLTGNAGRISVAFDTIRGVLACSNNAFDLDDEGHRSLVTGKVTCVYE